MEEEQEEEEEEDWLAGSPRSGAGAAAAEREKAAAFEGVAGQSQGSGELQLPEELLQGTSMFCLGPGNRLRRLAAKVGLSSG